ncbi:MAG: hypothetical protein A2X23_09895 [Chloroflexi bacterium GWC2_73_18]|nr:MAG: hypothetical protein A2X23_09895 [Chloroflexi bacterium GWC2_73_18]
MAAPGRLCVGTSGYSYASWIPAFYPLGTKAAEMLARYAARLPAVELNNTFYRVPTKERVDGWLAATPPGFRFASKAHQAVSHRARLRSPEQVEWLAGGMRLFGERLGCVLVQTPANLARDDARLAGFLAAWPRELPVAFEFRHPSWLDDAVLALLTEHGAALCAAEHDGDPEPPRLFATAPHLYLRLRRDAYTDAELDAWVGRVVPFLDDGRDVYLFFKHDGPGVAPALALRFAGRAGALRRA